MNFFLYSKKGLENDYLMVDRLVEESQGSYDDQFAKLALFAFHLSNSGAWKGTKWADGRVAGWANTLIREHAWQKDRWLEGVFQDQVLKDYIADNVAGVRETKTKVFTNYRYMLKSAKVLGDDRDNTIKFREPWYANAIQLFWDRRIFDGSIGVNSDSEAFERSFVNEEIYKLLGCSKEQGLVFSRAAFRQYPSLFANRIQQVESLRAAGAIAA